MTPTEQRVLDAVRAGHATRERIAKAAGTTVASVHTYLARLRKRGMVEAARGSGERSAWSVCQATTKE